MLIHIDSNELSVLPLGLTFGLDMNLERVCILPKHFISQFDPQFNQQEFFGLQLKEAQGLN
jgi:hypothetical protein